MHANIVSASKLAQILEVEPETIRKWRKAGLIPGIVINSRVVRFDADEVVAALGARANTPPPLRIILPDGSPQGVTGV